MGSKPLDSAPSVSYVIKGTSVEINRPYGLRFAMAEQLPTISQAAFPEPAPYQPEMSLNEKQQFMFGSLNEIIPCTPSPLMHPLDHGNECYVPPMFHGMDLNAGLPPAYTDTGNTGEEEYCNMLAYEGQDFDNGCMSMMYATDMYGEADYCMQSPSNCYDMMASGADDGCYALSTGEDGLGGDAIVDDGSAQTLALLGALSEKIRADGGSGDGGQVVEDSGHMTGGALQLDDGLHERDQSYTTVMLRNIPNKYTRDMLVDQLKWQLAGQFDFLYLPTDFRNKCNVGYAFINFCTQEARMIFEERFHGVEVCNCLPGLNSKKVVEVTPARVQGLEKNVERLRNSPAMNELVAHPEWMPLIFDEVGSPLPFPSPDRPLQPFKARRRVRDDIH